MRKGLLSSVATALVGAGSALAVNPYTVPLDNRVQPAGVTAAAPALLSADQTTQAAPVAPAAPAKTDCVGTAAAPSVNCCPQNCGPNRPRFYGDVSYMLMWVKDPSSTPPLAVLGQNPLGVVPGVNKNNPGFPAAALLGGDNTTFDGQNGIRGTVGMWLGCNRQIGIEASGFIVERAEANQILAGDGAAGSLTIVRPFLDLNGAVPTIGQYIVTAPGIPGFIAEHQTTELWGAEVNGVLNWRQDCNRTTDLLAGFVYTDLHETLGVRSSTTMPGAGTSVIDDAIGTRNQFYAPQFGTRTSWCYGQFSLTMVGTIAAGVNHETIDRLGNTTTISPAGVVLNNSGSGFLVQASNRGRISTDHFCVGTPSRITLDYHFTDNLAAYVGYDFIYLTTVVRPGNQVDPTFQTVGNTVIRPAGGFNHTDFWANSFIAGVSWKF
jgi:hypothetical protein